MATLKKRGSSRKAAESQEFDEIMKEYETPQMAPMEQGSFLFYAFATSVMPAYLFFTVYDLGIRDFGIFYAVVTAASTYFLSTAYRNIASSAQIRLTKGRHDVALSNGKKAEWKEEMNKKESVAWALFLCNIIFFATFGFVAFYVLQEVDPRFRYALSVTLGSALAWQLSSTL